jgi:two-component system CheB/CheR fusion protein
LFHNLISNSLKFSKETSAPVIAITSHRLSPEDLNAYPQLDKMKRYSEIIIEDNGIGFDSEFAEQIFVIFQRLEDQKHYPGTGIGLALVRKIVNNHSGAIKAESKQGEGARFKIILPEKQENE